MRPDFEHPAVDQHMKSRASAFRALIFFVFAALVAHLSIVPAHAARRRPLPTREPVWFSDPLEVKGPLVSTPCLSADGETLYVGSGNGRLYALDAFSGALKWTNALRLPGPIYAPLTISEDGMILVGCSDGRLYGISDQGDSGRIDLNSFPLGRPLSGPALDRKSVV